MQNTHNALNLGPTTCKNTWSKSLYLVKKHITWFTCIRWCEFNSRDHQPGIFIELALSHFLTGGHYLRESFFELRYLRDSWSHNILSESGKLLFVFNDNHEIFQKCFQHLLPNHGNFTRNAIINLPVVRLEVERNFAVFRGVQVFRGVPPDLRQPMSAYALKKLFKVHAISQYDWDIYCVFISIVLPIHFVSTLNMYI